MNKDPKLFLVPLIFIIIIGVWFFGIKDYKFFDIEGMGKGVNEVKTSFLDMWNKSSSAYNPGANMNLDDIKTVIKDQLTEEESKTKVQQIVQEKLKQEISESKVEYSYEPWGIKVSYFNNANKTFDDKTQKIIFRYDDKNFLEINRGVFKEKKFDDWLIKNFDLQKLAKENINGLVFWSKEQIKDNNLDKNYYINIDKNVYYIAYHCLINSLYCDKLEQTAKTFAQTK